MSKFQVWLLCLFLVFPFAACAKQEQKAEAAKQEQKVGVIEQEKDEYAFAREKMVSRQIAARGVSDKLVLAAMRKVQRHRFVPENMVVYAYEDRPLPIGEDQTISQPYIVALMTEVLKLKGPEKILEIGTGSGYQAAVLAEIVAEVYTI